MVLDIVLCSDLHGLIMLIMGMPSYDQKNQRLKTLLPIKALATCKTW